MNKESKEKGKASMTKCAIWLIVGSFSILSMPFQVYADQNDSTEDWQELFVESFTKSCCRGLLQSALHDFGMLANISDVEHIPATLRAKIEEIVQPLYGTCECMANKASVKVSTPTGNQTAIKVDLFSVSPVGDCAPPAVPAYEAKEKLRRLVFMAPPVPVVRKMKRIPFVISGPAGNGISPSLFASHERPPAEFARTVFLARGTGIACPPRELCVDKAGLKVTRAADFPARWLRVLGQEGEKNLAALIKQFGGDLQIVTSGNNFTNFVPSIKAGVFEYSIERIDDTPIENTKVKKLWIVVFNSQQPDDSRAIAFSPAHTSIIELEFLDGE